MEFFSPGKVLLTAEYAVLDGAKALALPTKPGQRMLVQPIAEPSIYWKAYLPDNELWFEAKFDWKEDRWITRTPDPKAERLQDIFRVARELDPGFLDGRSGFRIETQLDFAQDWGLGSSSTLINNIAQWGSLDAFALQEAIFGGSGYDIAAAQNRTPIFFTRTKESNLIEATSLNWKFRDHLYFLHLNRKQNSREAIAHYRGLAPEERPLERLWALSEAFQTCQSLEELMGLIQEHESLVSNMIGIPPIQTQLFPDFTGRIKSLGGWGGDLVLIASSTDPSAYFAEKGYPTIIPFNRLIP